MSKIPFYQLNDQCISKLQYATIIICFLMNVLDGMDVLIISFCAPAIAISWEVGPETLGVVFSVGLAGMALGALVMAPYADHIGRKRMILISSFLMGISVLCKGFANTVPQLIVLRLISGLGIGSMLATTASLTSEYLPNRFKDFLVSFVLAGYPVGAM
ncbi:MFS transporter [Maribacter confluentis]|uniref:MFS transporter n=1 Tax=Maribacter confluentis TaxID=1656093 RepID=A0ABT8RPC5_9FLAO|nr:MFS transporter [Maribacter confluentis]MDO1512739.1 MFS transporter [Maribacter confluentis]